MGTALIASRHSSPWGLTEKNPAGGAAELGAPDGLEHQKERSLSEGEPESMDSYVPTIRTRPPYVRNDMRSLHASQNTHPCVRCTARVALRLTAADALT